ncbi:MAG: alpha/beta hydrolase [Flavobacteriaceae bacterium]|nr:alpha/beta hydrolase [Flavobacteriaceae bacterium]
MIETRKNIVLNGRDKKPILTDVFYKNNNQPKSTVIFCHGYKGFKDWGAWDLVAQEFANHNIFFIKFNFSHNGGTIEQPIDFPDLEAFGHNNYIKELDDLQTVIDWIIAAEEFQSEINQSDISLIGHSRGGGIVTLKASEEKRIRNIISWAGVSDYESRFPTGEILELWKKEGVAYVENGRTKQQMPHYFQFYTNFMEHKDRLTINKACKKIMANHLIVHGSTDEVVTLSEAESLHKWSEKSELYVIDSDHTFGAKHPWDVNYLPDSLDTITRKTIEFITHGNS